MGRYGKEFLVAALLSIFVGAWIFHQYAHTKRERAERTTRQEIAQVRQLQELQKVWNSRGVAKKLMRVKGAVSASKVERFERKGNRLKVRMKNLDPKEINRVLSAIASLPLRIRTLDVRRTGDRFSLECACVW